MGSALVLGDSISVGRETSGGKRANHVRIAVALLALSSLGTLFAAPMPQGSNQSQTETKAKKHKKAKKKKTTEKK